MVIIRALFRQNIETSDLCLLVLRVQVVYPSGLIPARTNLPVLTGHHDRRPILHVGAVRRQAWRRYPIIVRGSAARYVQGGQCVKCRQSRTSLASGPNYEISQSSGS